MNEVFEKILERLEELQNNLLSQTEGDVSVQVGIINGVMYSKKIVQEAAEEYKGGWIPCSERLPKYGEVVMCSCTNSGITISCITHKGVKPSKSVRFGQHSVIAWQPLPKPFQKGDNNENS